MNKYSAAAAACAPFEGKKMSSREIARLTAKRHNNVLRDIRKLMSQGAISGSRCEESSYMDIQNKKQVVYHLDFRATMVLVTGYNPALRDQVIARWMELENRAARSRSFPGNVELGDIAGGGRRSVVRHLTGPESPSGLPIKCSLDLTQIARRPTKFSVEFVQRVTGVDLSGLLDQQVQLHGSSESDSTVSFVEAACWKGDGNSRVSLKDAHAAYKKWHRLSGLPGADLGSSKRLAIALREAGFRTKVVGGITCVFGLDIDAARCREEQGLQVPAVEAMYGGVDKLVREFVDEALYINGGFSVGGRKEFYCMDWVTLNDAFDSFRWWFRGLEEQDIVFPSMIEFIEALKRAGIHFEGCGGHTRLRGYSVRPGFENKGGRGHA